MTGALVSYTTWESIENFIVGISRTSANVLVIYGCSWHQASTEAIECVRIMLESVGWVTKFGTGWILCT